MPVTSGLRRWAGRAGRMLWPRRLVFVYHRVAEPAHDPWRLAVAPRRFDEQLQVLRAFAPVMPLGRMLRGLDAGTLPDRAVAVTFDDGYADTLLAAAPLLERHDVPATVHLCPGLLDGRTSFWWDALTRIVFGPDSLPARLETRIGGETIVWPAAPEGPAAPVRAPGDTAAARRDLHLTLWAALQALPHAMRRPALIELAAWAGLAEPDDPAARPMSRDEAARLAAGGLVEIGAHTMTHPRLPDCSPERQKAEIEDSKSGCEAIAGSSVGGFSYPYGAHGPETRRLVRAAGFTSAGTTAAGPLAASVDRFLLPRIPALDWDGAELERRLATLEFA